MQSRPPSRTKLILFSLITSFLFFALTNLAINILEEGGFLSTWNQDDLQQFNAQAIVGASAPGDALSEIGRRKTLKSYEPSGPKNGAWRFMTFGGSFALGTPYSYVGMDSHLPGGISSFLEGDLKTRFPDQKIEVLNFAAGSIPSGIVKTLVRRNFEEEPDAIFVATCNNEGSLNPSAVSKALNELGGYRFLKRMLKPEAALSDRPTHTAQQIHPEAIRTQFRENLTDIADSTKSRNIPLFLATLPVNMRYAGDEAGHLIDKDGTLQHDAPTVEKDVCIKKGKELFSQGHYVETIEHLQGCENATEALRWEGLSLLEMGRVEEGKTALNLSIELNPRNRCRPSLNLIIREIAAKYPHITLVDLEKRAIEISRDGLPGRNLFLDYCHMHWRGYYEMAQVLLEALNQSSLLPPEEQAISPSMETLRSAFGLQDISKAGDITRPSSQDARSLEFGTLNLPEPGVQGDIHH